MPPEPPSKAPSYWRQFWRFYKWGLLGLVVLGLGWGLVFFTGTHFNWVDSLFLGFVFAFGYGFLPVTGAALLVAAWLYFRSRRRSSAA